MAQIEPLSLAEPIFSPVLIRDWTVASSLLVLDRFWRAIIAPTFVLTLFSAMARSSFFKVSGVVLTAGGVLPGSTCSKDRAITFRERRPATDCFCAGTLP